MISSYFQQVIFDSSLMIILATGLGITYGHAGILSLCHAILFGAGAYFSALLFPFYSTGIWIVDILSICIAGLCGGLLLSAIIGAICLNLRGDFVALATLAFGELVRAITLNLEVLGGARGIRDIPKLATPWTAVSIAIIIVLFSRSILRNPWGRMMEATRDNAAWADGIGIPTQKSRFTAFVYGGGLAGIAGALFAFKQQYIHPNSFNIMISITILLAVILGGRGNLTGYILGAIFFSVTSESLRFFLPQSADWRAMGIGAILLITSWFFTKGMLGKWPYKDPVRRWFGKLGSEKREILFKRLKDKTTDSLKINTLLIENLKVITPESSIINDISITIKPGIPVALIGPNGSGKSTFAKALAGDIPCLGKIMVNDVNVNSHPRLHRDKNEIIQVPQHPYGFQKLNALDNVRLAFDRAYQTSPFFSWLPLSGNMHSRQSTTHAKQFLEKVGLKDREKKIFSTMSYGQRKRTLLAAALLADPLVLILDEPFAGLNSGPGSEAEIITNALKPRLESPYRITIIIDHRLELLKPLCKDIILLDEGRVQSFGDLTNVMQTSHFRDIYERAAARS